MPGQELATAQPTDYGLLRIGQAQHLLAALLREHLPTGKPARQQFATYLWQQVRLVATEVPVNFDLNRLFEAINNRGEQLQHHEILKSRLLALITNRRVRAVYAQLWNACAAMDGYLEQTTWLETGHNLTAWRTSEAAQLNSRAMIRDLCNGAQASHSQTNTRQLSRVLNDRRPVELVAPNSNGESHPALEGEQPVVRSILTFPQLLLHTLRLFQLARGADDIARISEKELLQLFETSQALHSSQTAKQFIELLWNVRFVFDCFVIKWVRMGSEEWHMNQPLSITNRTKGGKKWYFTRTQPSRLGRSPLELLQSMLYHSQAIITHYWLTPLLHRALHDRNRESLTRYLQQLDNDLFCTKASEQQREKTWQAMQHQGIPAASRVRTCAILDQSLGVHFPHYWFYKLDFVLWHFLREGKDEKWQNFRFTAKNSVEHVSPQAPRDADENVLSREQLDTFGNLALVSRSVNSEASNHIFNTKRSEFLAKAVPDSLKSALIYEHPTWNDQQCQEHQQLMKYYLNAYFTEY